MNFKLERNGDRRNSPRFKVSCRCWIEQDSVTLFGTVTNLSKTGFFLRTLPLIDEGTDIDVKLSLDRSVVVARGEVKWASKNEQVEGPKALYPPGLGVELTELQGGHDLLDKFVKRASLIPEPFK